MVWILSTLLAADSGRTRVAGYDVTSDPDGVRSRPTQAGSGAGSAACSPL
jgi:ABC-type Na+ transport system ATPase subunit NatA